MTDTAKAETVTISRIEYKEMQDRLWAVDIAKPQIRFLVNVLSEHEDNDIEGLSGILALINAQLKGQLTKEDIENLEVIA